MNKPTKIIHGLVILAILCFSFYWFAYRPEQIRKKCYDLTFYGAPERTEMNYNSCLLEHGFNK